MVKGPSSNVCDNRGYHNTTEAASVGKIEVTGVTRFNEGLGMHLHFSNGARATLSLYDNPCDGYVMARWELTLPAISSLPVVVLHGDSPFKRYQCIGWIDERVSQQEVVSYLVVAAKSENFSLDQIFLNQLQGNCAKTFTFGAS